MKRFAWWTIPALGLAVLLPTVSRAATPRARPFVGPPAPVKPSHQDFLFLASTRPVLLRLHLQIDGRPYYAPWDAYMKKLFAQFDRDGNGVLSKAEAERAPEANYLMNHLQGAIFGNPQPASMQQMDTNKDGKVSPAEFRAYYRRSGFAPLRLSMNDNATNARESTDVICKHLGAGKDGKLTPARLAKAPTAFRRLDMDEDEMITVEELIPERFNQGFFGFGGGFPGQPRKGEGPALVEVRQDQPVQGLAQQILARYDKDKDGKLTRAESGLDRATFAALDRNKDGRLDAAELAGFFSRPADLEFLGRIGKVAKKEDLGDLILRGLGAALGDDKTQPERLGVYNPKKRAMPLASVVKRTSSASLAFEMGDTKVGLTAGDRGSGSFRLRQFFQRQFSNLDQKKKGYVDRKEAMTNNFVNEIFNLADRNGDGKLYQKELNAYFDLQEEGSRSFLTLNVNDQGRSLFDLLDSNNDGRLSMRELRDAWKRLKPMSADRTAFARGSIPRRVQVTLGNGNGGGRFAPPAAYGYSGGRPTPRKAAPLWFRKMDRNNDNDLSPREFLGTEEEFKKLDADGDGLISADEALAADARMAKKAPPKK